MGRITPVENSKLTALVSKRDRIQRFYRDVLGWNVIVKEGSDLVRPGDNFHIGIRYGDSALREDDMLKSVWLKLSLENPDEIRMKILDSGIKRPAFREKKRFRFQAPGAGLSPGGNYRKHLEMEEMRRAGVRIKPQEAQRENIPCSMSPVPPWFRF